MGRFAGASRRAAFMATPWGRLPVVSIPELVELKKTNRPADYDVITRLALIHLTRVKSPSPRQLRWTLERTCLNSSVDSEQSEEFPPLRDRFFRRELGRGESPRDEDIDRAAGALGARAQKLQALGRRYWAPRIEELRALRSEGRLIPEGTPVTRALLVEANPQPRELGKRRRKTGGRGSS